jgi:dCMP deaminase
MLDRRSIDSRWVVASHEQRQNKWDNFFLGMADYMATASKDPSTKVGAVIVRPDLSVASVGFNGFARSMNDTPELYENRDEKYSRIIHAETNAILNAHGPVEGYTLYTTLAPCDRCAVMVIQAGIKRVVSRNMPESLRQRWEASLRRSSEFFTEAGVEFILID